jgi:hypothetical protein
MTDDRIAQFLPSRATIWEDMAEPRKESTYCLERINSAVAALDIGACTRTRTRRPYISAGV